MGLPIFVISLPRSHERRDTIQSNLRMLGLPFTFVDGVDASVPSVMRVAPYDPRLTQATISRQLSTGEIGCYMAHLGIWQKVVREGIERCLILEDDALLSLEAGIQIENAFESAASFDLLNLISDTDEELNKSDFLSSTHHFTRFHGLANRASAYVLTLNAAKKLLSAALPIRMELDRLTGLREFADLKIMGIYPPVATLQPVDSEIWGNTNNPPPSVMWNRKVRRVLNPNVAILNPKLRSRTKKKMASRIWKIVRRTRRFLAHGRHG